MRWFKAWNKNHLEVKLGNSSHLKVMNSTSTYFSLLSWAKGLSNKGFVKIDNTWSD